MLYWIFWSNFHKVWKKYVELKKLHSLLQLHVQSNSYTFSLMVKIVITKSRPLGLFYFHILENMDLNSFQFGESLHGVEANDHSSDFMQPLLWIIHFESGLK